MSMTQLAILRKADIPTNKQIQDAVQKLGYDFEILSGLDRRLDQEGLECSINGHKTYFETYVDDAEIVISENEAAWIKPDITVQDTAISFIWGADFAAATCIGLISIALIDQSSALIYYVDDQMKYTREMLLEDAPQLLAELSKQEKVGARSSAADNFRQPRREPRVSFWKRLKNIFN